jgi:hypothetical protein
MFKTPDLTPAQIVAILGSVLTLAVSFGVDISQAQQDALLQCVGLIAGALIVGDAVVRHGRATGTADRSNKGDE